jgi:pSer/pThr/pTyr-binding forkhead associated (FHA) protein
MPRGTYSEWTGVFLKGLTPEARESLGSDFRIGRERRVRERLGEWFHPDRRIKTRRPSNDLYIQDPEPSGQISAQHFAINDVEGVISLEDLGSETGTIVDGVPVGRGGFFRKVGLHHSDVIIAGPSRSPFVFKLLIQ